MVYAFTNAVAVAAVLIAVNAVVQRRTNSITTGRNVCLWSCCKLNLLSFTCCFSSTKSVRKRCLNFLVESALRGNDISKQRIDIFLSRYPNSKQIDCALQSVRQQNMRFVHVIHNICWSIDILHDVLVDDSAFYSSALIAITRWHD